MVLGTIHYSESLIGTDKYYLESKLAWPSILDEIVYYYKGFEVRHAIHTNYWSQSLFLKPLPSKKHWQQIKRDPDTS